MKIVSHIYMLSYLNYLLFNLSISLYRFCFLSSDNNSDFLIRLLNGSILTRL